MFRMQNGSVHQRREGVDEATLGLMLPCRLHLVPAAFHRIDPRQRHQQPTNEPVKIVKSAEPAHRPG
jgi:hypothetical protein